MNAFRYSAAVTTLVVLSGLSPVWSQDKVLVPGNPPLTQEVVNLYQQMWEWYCDIQLTPEQRQQHQYFVNFWKKNGLAVTKPLLASYRAMEKEWRGILELKGAEQDRKRVEMSARWMSRLRNGRDDPPGRFLVSVYDDAYKPGGTKYPILVAGEPPLTQSLVTSYTDFLAYLVALNLGTDDRKTFQALVVADWKEWNRGARDAFLKQLAEWDTVSKKGGQFDYRAKLLPSFLDRNGDPKKTSAGERWMLEAYQSVYKKIADQRPIARMDKQPRPHAALAVENGFPADPKHPNIFATPSVFTQSQVYSRHWDIRCLGSERVKGTEKEIIVRRCAKIT
jgi:hypothetical protein